MTDSPLKSSLLVAMPQLQDPNFKRTVVLLVHHDDDGTFGLVLNVLVVGLLSVLSHSRERPELRRRST